MKTSLFLSNSEIVDTAFLHFCHSNEIELVARSLISFKPVPYDSIPDAEVVFFSSPRSVEFFIESVKNKKYSFACIGNGTAKRLETYGFKADFVGSNAGQPDTVAEEFLHWIGKRKVIFPLSTKSNRSVSSHVPVGQRFELIVYETILTGLDLNYFDVYVFTSPSNVEAFLEVNDLPSESKVIAWGNTTEKRLLKRGISPFSVLQKSNLRELEDLLSD
jgi:uroporphyrinogen-III synthase